MQHATEAPAVSVSGTSAGSQITVPESLVTPKSVPVRANESVPAPVAASYTARVVFLADGRLVDELHAPTADSVLERMSQIQLRHNRQGPVEFQDAALAGEPES